MAKADESAKKTKRRIYILPTRFGAIFIAGACTMIIIGSAFQNNLVNLVAYFMLALVFTSAIQTQENLKDVRVEGIESEGGFAGSEFVVTTVLANTSRRTRFNLETRLKRIKARAHYESSARLPARGALRIRSAYVAGRRGRHSTRGARLSSLYPLGLFEAWTWEDVESTYYVYPALVGHRRLPLESAPGDAGALTRPNAGDDFHGHRLFREGDSHRRIDWKAHARGRPLLVKEFSDGAPGALVLDWKNLKGLDLESRLSQLAVWVDEARERKLIFSLKLPDAEIPAGHGLAHAQRCWQALAVCTGEERSA